MTRAEFIARWTDELRGLQLAAFAEDQATIGKFDQKGRFMVNEMRKAPDLLGRMYDSLNLKPPVPPPNGQPRGATSEHPKQSPVK